MINFLFLFLLAIKFSYADIQEIVPQWSGTTIHDLHNEYSNIFKYGNRNAAAHRWASFILDHANSMNMETLKILFSGFCAVSGSPVRPRFFNDDCSLCSKAISDFFSDLFCSLPQTCSQVITQDITFDFKV